MTQEIQQLEDLYSMGFIQEAEYMERLAALKGTAGAVSDVNDDTCSPLRSSLRSSIVSDTDGFLASSGDSLRCSIEARDLDDDSLFTPVRVAEEPTVQYDFGHCLPLQDSLTQSLDDANSLCDASAFDIRNSASSLTATPQAVIAMVSRSYSQFTQSTCDDDEESQSNLTKTPSAVDSFVHRMQQCLQDIDMTSERSQLRDTSPTGRPQFAPSNQDIVAVLAKLRPTKTREQPICRPRSSCGGSTIVGCDTGDRLVRESERLKFVQSGKLCTISDALQATELVVTNANDALIGSQSAWEYRLFRIGADRFDDSYEFESATTLQTLDLAFNNLTSLPDSVGQLTALTRIDISGCRFTTFPKILCKLPNLQYIDAAYNHIQDIPPEIASMPALISLNLFGNNLDPEQVAWEALEGKFGSSGKLDIAGCPRLHHTNLVSKHPRLAATLAIATAIGNGMNAASPSLEWYMDVAHQRSTYCQCNATGSSGGQPLMAMPCAPSESDWYPGWVNTNAHWPFEELKQHLHASDLSDSKRGFVKRAMQLRETFAKCSSFSTPTNGAWSYLAAPCTSSS